MILERLHAFWHAESGAFTFDWALQMGVVVLVSAMILSSITTGDEVSSTGHTHFNGYTITSQYP